MRPPVGSYNRCFAPGRAGNCSLFFVMERFLIANLTVDMECNYPMMIKRSRKFLFEGEPKGEADITLSACDEELIELKKRVEAFSVSDCEYMVLCEKFYKELLKFDGMLLHASAVEYKNRAYLFSANSGVGKSTHTHLWLKYIDSAEILNDDKPAIRRIGENYFAFGTPFSGKTDEAKTTGAQLGAIVFLERALENRIEKLSAAEALPLIMGQTIRPSASVKYMEILLEFLDGLIRTVPIYKLYCDISSDAVGTSFEELTGEKFPKENDNED